MKKVVDKPKVFLSHSKKDESFIKKLFNDLHRCQIAPWLDTEEIRHGKPWLDTIFNDGIPNCDCLFVYLTKDSISSSMVKKEVDAGLLQQLNNSCIGFLPYVSEEEIRKKVRIDIQNLQIPVLNSNNYDSLLPRIVAEVWRCYLEKSTCNVFRYDKFYGLKAIFPHAVGHDWINNIKKSTDITIAKLKINFTDNPSYFISLKDVLIRNGSVTLIMSDPRSPAMWLRYMEEPSGVANGSTTETSWKQGLEELSVIFDRFKTWRDNLIKEGVSVDKLRIKAFPHYPTHAYYKFDNNLYVFHYPFRKRGFHGPLFLFSDPSTDIYKFLNDSLSEVVRSSVLLENVIDDIRLMYKNGKLSDKEVSKYKIGMVPV